MTVEEKRNTIADKIYELSECLRTGDLLKIATAKELLKYLAQEIA